MFFFYWSAYTNTGKWAMMYMCVTGIDFAFLNDFSIWFLVVACQGWWFSAGTPASSTSKTGRHDIAEILLKVALNTKNQIKSIGFWTCSESVVLFYLFFILLLAQNIIILYYLQTFLILFPTYFTTISKK